MPKVKTYDILNAGPRNRFMANGRIVSNSGMKVQLQNLPRGTVEYDWQQQLIPSMYRGDLDTLGLICNSPMQAVSDLIRLMLIPDPGNEFLVADFSAIEARGLAFLAGEEKVLQTFREGADIYLVAGEGIFGRKLTKKDKQERQISKCAVLALGYQGGVGAFQNMAKIYGVSMGPVFPLLWERASQEDRDKAKNAYETRGKARTAGKITEEAWLASELTKIAWRRDNPNIVQFWKDLENAAVGAVANPGTVTSAGQFIKFRKDGPFLWCRLPSGRALCYPFPKLVAMAWVELLDGTATTMSVDVLERASRVVGGLANLGVAKVKGEARPSLTFKFWEQGRWATGHYYGGHGAENCLAGDTEVLTDSGWKPITEVSTFDAVWDGVTWVSHDGLMDKGVKETGTLRGVRMTPDHRVLWGDGRCPNWQTASQCEGFLWAWQTEPVYDLLNSGPRSRFTVRPAGGGEPMIVHNCTQAACRDLLSEALLRLGDRGYPVVLHVHDEAGAEVPIGSRRLEEFEAIMAEVPEWAPGFPIAAEGYRATRYHK